MTTEEEYLCYYQDDMEGCFRLLMLLLVCAIAAFGLTILLIL